MEGTLEQQMDAFANEETQPNLKEEIVEVKNTDVLKVGQVYKITGGKWKKYKKAKVVKINKTYSDVWITEHNPPNVKCKNCYLHPCEEIIEMPDADNLQVVDNSVDINKLYEEQHQADDNAVLPVPEEHTEAPAHDPIGGTAFGVVDDITAVLPSIEEALKLREDMNKIFHYVYDTTDDYDGKVDEMIGEIQHWVNHQLLEKLKIVKKICDLD
jgi:uncharacterized protein Veg